MPFTLPGPTRLNSSVLLQAAEAVVVLGPSIVAVVAPGLHAANPLGHVSVVAFE